MALDDGQGWTASHLYGDAAHCLGASAADVARLRVQTCAPATSYVQWRIKPWSHT